MRRRRRRRRRKKKKNNAFQEAIRVAAAAAAGYMVQDDKSFDLPWEGKKKQRSFFLLKPPSVTKPVLLDRPCNVEQRITRPSLSFWKLLKLSRKGQQTYGTKKDCNSPSPPVMMMRHLSDPPLPPRQSRASR
jgi:hypothetical protein